MTQKTAAETQSPIVAKIWQRFQDVGFTPDFGPEGSRLLIALYRRLAAEGRPIPPHEVEELAERFDVSVEAAADLIERSSERDDDGAVRGIVGLSLNDHPHRFRVGEHELRNWCALDPLLIMPIMTKDVALESTDPQNGEVVYVAVSPDGVSAQEPEQAVMSIVVPAPGATDSLGDVWMTFCHQVHFFSSREAGEQFFADKDFEIYFLTLDEAFVLAQLTFAPLNQELS